VPLNEYRYSLPPNGGPDLQLNQRSVFDFHGSRLYTDASTLACEDAIMTARKDKGGPAVRPAVIMDSLDSGGRLQVPRLHADQRAAVADVVLSGNRLDAIAGPAGTGKTTTLSAVKALWEAEHGAGSVIGLAPAAASAAVLSHELHITTENVAKWLHESMGQGAATRAERFFHIQELLGSSTYSDRRSIACAQEAARLAATQQRWCFHPNQLVIIDEASMVSTFQLAGLVQQAKEAGGKILLVGDPGQLDAIDAGGVLGWLDRQGLATRLRTIWRFHEEWERSSSLKLRAGDYSAIEDYEQHRRIRHGSYLGMLDQAYLAWQADMQSGKSSILIAADNETVNMLNERARADLVAQGVVDAELTAHLTDGLQAGSGDTIIARGNNRRLIDSEGEFVRNGTLFDVRAVNRHDGSVLAVRRQTGASVVLPRAYLERYVELGYATTAHRSQGLTVDTGHTVVTQGRLTRELLYVSMTRGRSGNFAYVSEGDDSDHQAVDPSQHLSWRSILGEVLAAEGAERTAHEVRETERMKADNLERLYAEYDYLAQIAAGEDLRRCLGKIDPVAVPGLSASPSWGAAVAAWRKATAWGRHGAERVMERTVQDRHSVHDPMAHLSARLRRCAKGTPSTAIDPLRESFPVLGPELTDMIVQVRERIRQRTEIVTWAALTQDVPWKDELTAAVGATDSFGQLVRDVALFRDRWGIYDSHLPLGGRPADYEWEQLGQRQRLHEAIERARRCQAAPHPEMSPPDMHRSQQVVLTSSDWQI
jgi:hypothetical protein